MISSKPFMSDAEWSFLQQHLDKKHSMLEYGSGSSTIAIAPKVNLLHSVEHKTKWFWKVKNNTSKFDNITLHLVKSTAKKDKEIPAQYKDYIDYIKLPTKINKIFDTVLIDGRARQWVAESILPFIHKESKVFIHDFVHRPRYSRVHQFYDVIKTVDTMVMLKKK